MKLFKNDRSISFHFEADNCMNHAQSTSQYGFSHKSIGKKVQSSKEIQIISKLSVLTQFHSHDAQGKDLVRANSSLEQSLSVDRDQRVSFEYL